MGLNRRAVLATIALGVAAGIAYRSTNLFHAVNPWQSIAPATVTFGEWELLVLDVKNAALLVIDPIEEVLLARLDVGGKPTGILHSGNGLAVSVDANTRRIVIFRRTTTIERLVIDLDLVPELVTLSPGGALLAVLDRTHGVLAFYSSDDGRELGRKTGLAGVDSLMFGAFGETLYVTRKHSPEVIRIDPVEFSTVDPIAVQGVHKLDNLLPVPGADSMVAFASPSGQQALHMIDLGSGAIEQSFFVSDACFKCGTRFARVLAFCGLKFSTGSLPSVSSGGIPGHNRNRRYCCRPCA